ncbi:MAG: hypothetical protein IPP71_02170 [Bacteroidetes bacterium]|nr:hypothetical protein [Bacteroidota bacterium]
MSKATAGYHMLMILSAVDGKFNGKEDFIIKTYMEENLDALTNLEGEMAVISALPTNDYAVHFNDAMNQFYIQSTKAERNQFLDMATRLIAADKEISPKENLFLNELFNAWDEEFEE